jgi:hypothetical protein
MVNRLRRFFYEVGRVSAALMFSLTYTKRKVFNDYKTGRGRRPAPTSSTQGRVPRTDPAHGMEKNPGKLSDKVSGVRRRNVALPGGE